MHKYIRFALFAGVEVNSASEALHAYQTFDQIQTVLGQCNPAMATLRRHEKELFMQKILTEKNLNLLHLEHTLLQLSAEKDVTKGVLYFFGVRHGSGTMVVR